MYTKGRVGEMVDAKRLIELEAFLEDAKAYISFCLRKELPMQGIVTNLAHDIGGLSRKERCFSPRVSGYAEAMNGREQ